MDKVHLHNEAPSLKDVPNRLRFLADNIEAGRHGEITRVFVVIPRRLDYPTVLGYGDIEGSNDPIVQLALAQHLLVTSLVVRK